MHKYIFLILLLLFTTTNSYSNNTTFEPSQFSDPLPEVTSIVSNYALEEIQRMQSERDQYLVLNFISENGRYFRSSDLYMIGEMLKEMSRSEILALDNIEFRDPTVSLALSVLIGGLGADRFYVGDIGLGVAKLLTCGGFGIWWLIDMFIISGRAKDKNAKEINDSIVLYNRLKY